jgi:hypothetical protein
MLSNSGVIALTDTSKMPFIKTLFGVIAKKEYIFLLHQEGKINENIIS